MAASAQRLKEALAPHKADRGASAVPDGILSATPDAPDAEWRSRSVLDTVCGDSTLLEEADSKQPGALFGRYTWRISQFSELGKRELRSSQFDVGEYKW